MQETKFDPWVGKIPWRRVWQPTPVFLPGESHGQRSLVGYKGLQRVGHNWSDLARTFIFMWISVVFISVAFQSQLKIFVFSHKKEWDHATCSNMDGPMDGHTNWSKSDRERQISYDITYMWNLKMIQINLYTKQKQREQTYGYQSGEVGVGAE